MKKLFCIVSMVFIVKFSMAQSVKKYTEGVEKWHQDRIEDLKKPNGWLNLEGLFWLHKGVNSFGKAVGSDCYYTNSSFPNHLGNFIYEGDSVVWENTIQNGALVDNTLLPLGKKQLVFKEQASRDFAASFSFDQFRWVVIKREDKVGIRFRNLNAATLVNFKGIERFPVDPKWHIKAVLNPPVQNSIMITNIIGQTSPQKSAGILAFTVEGKQYTLDVIDEGGPKYFITFADETAGKTTYGAGRFIEISKPDANGNTEIDFNLAYNPPCAFTAFATCPLPPAQNRLTLSIPAGEKKFGHH